MKGKIYLISMILLFWPAISYGQSVGLVLSGGGAKGLSHIGVIKALEEYNIPVDYVCGTSMGAIIGGLYAAGFTPDEMIALFKSKEFEAWYRGISEQGYSSYFYRDDADASMFTFSLTRKKEDNRIWDNPFDLQEKPGLKVDFPTSIIPPYYMDFALVEVFAPASIAAGDNFDNLMIPFFCVASDIKAKRPLVMKNGNLGSAVRASMTFPFVFRPITIDSTLLFDGGFYNNFPWDIMVQEYNPDFIIGAKCVIGDTDIDEDDIVTHVSNMMTYSTKYSIPAEVGIVVERRYPYGLMDFHKIDEIVGMGYQNALLYIEKIKERLGRQRAENELDSMRMAFRGRQKEMLFEGDIEIAGLVNDAGKRFINNTMKGEDRQSCMDIKKGYYKVVAANRFKTLYPSYRIKDDSLLAFNLRVTKAPSWSVSIGGNISSSSLNQAFVGTTYSHLSERPWKLGAGVNVGKYYKGGYLFWRHDAGIDPLYYYRMELVMQQFDYYNGNQNLFVSDKLPGNIRQMEYYGRVEFVLPASMERNIFFKTGFVAGQEYYKYYQKNYNTDGGLYSDVANKTFLTIFSPMVGFERNTVDYPLYPVSGRREQLFVRYNYALEGYNKYLFKAKSEAYFRLSNRISLGYIADFVISNRNRLDNYISTMLYTPAFRPLPHNNTITMEGYRADSYLGVGISPVILFSNSLFLHCNISWFQPYESIVKSDSGNYHYTKPFPRGAMLAGVAFVWRSPIGPVSLSANYYEKGENRWYTQLNIGFLIFKKRVLEF